MRKQELLWVERNEHDVIVDVRELPPTTGDFVPGVKVTRVFKGKDVQTIGSTATN